MGVCNCIAAKVESCCNDPIGATSAVSADQVSEEQDEMNNILSDCPTSAPTVGASTDNVTAADIAAMIQSLTKCINATKREIAADDTSRRSLWEFLQKGFPAARYLSIIGSAASPWVAPAIAAGAINAGLNMLPSVASMANHNLTTAEEVADVQNEEDEEKALQTNPFSRCEEVANNASNAESYSQAELQECATKVPKAVQIASTWTEKCRAHCARLCGETSGNGGTPSANAPASQEGVSSSDSCAVSGDCFPPICPTSGIVTVSGDSDPAQDEKACIMQCISVDVTQVWAPQSVCGALEQTVLRAQRAFDKKYGTDQHCVFVYNRTEPTTSADLSSPSPPPSGNPGSFIEDSNGQGRRGSAGAPTNPGDEYDGDPPALDDQEWQEYLEAMAYLDAERKTLDTVAASALQVRPTHQQNGALPQQQPGTRCRTCNSLAPPAGPGCQCLQAVNRMLYSRLTKHYTPDGAFRAGMRYAGTEDMVADFFGMMEAFDPNISEEDFYDQDMVIIPGRDGSWNVQMDSGYIYGICDMTVSTEGRNTLVIAFERTYPAEIPEDGWGGNEPPSPDFVQLYVFVALLHYANNHGVQLMNGATTIRIVQSGVINPPAKAALNSLDQIYGGGGDNPTHQQAVNDRGLHEITTYGDHAYLLGLPNLLNTNNFVVVLQAWLNDGLLNDVNLEAPAALTPSGIAPANAQTVLTPDNFGTTIEYYVGDNGRLSDWDPDLTPLDRAHGVPYTTFTTNVDIETIIPRPPISRTSSSDSCHASYEPSTGPSGKRPRDPGADEGQGAKQPKGSGPPSRSSSSGGCMQTGQSLLETGRRSATDGTACPFPQYSPSSLLLCTVPNALSTAHYGETSNPTAEPSASPAHAPTSSPSVHPTSSPTAEPTACKESTVLCDCQNNEGGWGGNYSDCASIASMDECSSYCVYCDASNPTKYVGHEHEYSPKGCGSPTAEPSASPAHAPTRSPSVHPTSSPTAEPTACRETTVLCDCQKNEGGWGGNYSDCTSIASIDKCNSYCVYCDASNTTKYVGHEHEYSPKGCKDD